MFHTRTGFFFYRRCSVLVRLVFAGDVPYSYGFCFAATSQGTFSVGSASCDQEYDSTPVMPLYPRIFTDLTGYMINE